MAESNSEKHNAPCNKSTDRVAEPDSINEQIECIEGIFQCMNDISLMVQKARMLSREADVRAKFAVEFANRAVAEAQSAHQVSETLARTSRVVAALALEVSNKTDKYIDNLDESEYRYSRSIGTDTSFFSDDTYGDNSYNTDESFGCNASTINAKEMGNQESPADKATVAPFIEEKQMALINILNVELKDKSLVCEDGYEKQLIETTETRNNATGDIMDNCKENRPAEEIISQTLDEKRKMQLYRDSKKVAAMQSLATGDAPPQTSNVYQEQGT
ncbi:hypothetical protein DPMN_012431 [Dreissena polymorpha]|uniref:Uncharacterized protein n=1 Tax=Dreissena polymorpha TaxID=45954 RepID=A0A9D4N5T3_DREPO|nr:hypothetical protein DPMN_012431 [Dreissena polymorpha]